MIAEETMDPNDEYPGICMEKSLAIPLEANMLLPGYILRAIHVDEGALWEQVMDQSFGGYGPGDFHKIIVDNYDYDPSRVFVMFDDHGQPCATASSWRQHYRWGPGVGYVLFVGVARPYQGRGLGCAMTLHILHDFVQHGLSLAILETNEPNLPALKTYLKLGFQPRLLEVEHEARWQQIFAALNKKPVDYPRSIRPPVDAPHPPHPYPYELKMQGKV
jgi:mycothiol synthase